MFSWLTLTIYKVMCWITRKPKAILQKQSNWMPFNNHNKFVEWSRSHPYSLDDEPITHKACVKNKPYMYIDTSVMQDIIKTSEQLRLDDIPGISEEELQGETLWHQLLLLSGTYSIITLNHIDFEYLVKAPITVPHEYEWFIHTDNREVMNPNYYEMVGSMKVYASPTIKPDNYVIGRVND